LTQEDFIVHLFCLVDDGLNDDGLNKESRQSKDLRAKLYPSELVTLGLLFVLYGRSQRRFYQWLVSNFAALFPQLPERTRLFRLLAKHQIWADRFLEEPTLLNYGDSFGIELVHPRREGRTKEQIGKKGVSNGRWIVGIKFCPLLNGQGRFVDWDADTANVHDSDFQRLFSQWKHEAASLTDKGFHRSQRRGGDCQNLVICQRGQRNYRMIIETVFSSWTRVFALKKIGERAWKSIEARLSYACAAWNLLTKWDTKRSGATTASLSTAWIPI
jgi:hypothetical protein